MKKILTYLVAGILFALPVSAAETLEFEVSSDSLVTIEQKLPSAKEGADVSIIVYKPGKSATDITSGNNADVTVVEANQTVSEKDGNYKFSFYLLTGSGLYTATISSSAGDENTYEFMFSDPQVGKEILKQLNGIEDKDAFYTVIYGDPSDENDGAWRDLGFYIPLSETADTRKVSDLLCTYVNTVKPFDSEKPEEAVKIFRKIYVIELLNEGKVISSEGYDKYIDIESEDFADFYKKSYIDANAKTEMFSAIINKDFKSTEEFSDALLEQVVLKTVTYSDGYGNIRDILEKYPQKTGIPTTNLTSDHYKRVLGKTYASYTELKNALTSTNQVIVSGGGVSSGGGNSSNKVFGGSTNITPVVNTPPKPVPVESKTETFSDLSDYGWAEDAIETLYENGIVSGKAEDEFCPQDTVSREEFTAMIVRAMGIEGSAEFDFADVDKDAWYAPYIVSAAENGIIYGVEEGRFGVGEHITRQDIAVIISRALNIATEDAEAELFSDDGEISDYAKASVYSMRANGIISGYENGGFGPKAFATRAEAAVMIHRAFFK